MDTRTPMPNDPGTIPPKENPEPSSSVGPAIGIVIIVIVIILGGLYFWGAQLDSGADDNPLDAALLDGDMSSSDEVGDIESDLSAVDTADLDALDAELADIEAELNTTP